MTTLAQLTMNAGEGIPGSVLKWNLENNGGHYDRILIVDGDLTVEAKEYYSQFDNVEAIDSPWVDDHLVQYQKFADVLEDNEWCLYMDDDEAPGKNLNTLCHQLTQMLPQAGEASDANMIILPSILYITEDGSRYYRALHKPHPQDPRNGGHTKPVLFKKSDTLRFISSKPPSVHITPTHGAAQKAMYASGAWYYHFKSTEAYIINDCLFALVDPPQERYTEDEAVQFKTHLKESGISTIPEFREAAEAGTWSEGLQHFAKSNQYHVDRPISRLWMWWHHIAGHGATDESAPQLG